MLGGILRSVADKVREFIDVYIKLLKLDFIGHTARLFSYLLYAIITIFIFFCIILLAGFGMTEAFAEIGLSHVAASFCTVGVYVLLLFLVVILRKQITGFFAGRIISFLTEQNNKEPKEKE